MKLPRSVTYSYDASDHVLVGSLGTAKHLVVTLQRRADLEGLALLRQHFVTEDNVRIDIDLLNDLVRVTMQHVAGEEDTIGFNVIYRVYSGVLGMNSIFSATKDCSARYKLPTGEMLCPASLPIYSHMLKTGLSKALTQFGAGVPEAPFVEKLPSKAVLPKAGNYLPPGYGKTTTYNRPTHTAAVLDDNGCLWWVIDANHRYSFAAMRVPMMDIGAHVGFLEWAKGGPHEAAIKKFGGLPDYCLAVSSSDLWKALGFYVEWTGTGAGWQYDQDNGTPYVYHYDGSTRTHLTWYWEDTISLSAQKLPAYKPRNVDALFKKLEQKDMTTTDLHALWFMSQHLYPTMAFETLLLNADRTGNEIIEAVLLALGGYASASCSISSVVLTLPQGVISVPIEYQRGNGELYTKTQVPINWTNTSTITSLHTMHIPAPVDIHPGVYDITGYTINESYSANDPDYKVDKVTYSKLSLRLQGKSLSVGQKASWRTDITVEFSHEFADQPHGDGRIEVWMAINTNNRLVWTWETNHPFVQINKDYLLEEKTLGLNERSTYNFPSLFDTEIVDMGFVTTFGTATKDTAGGSSSTVTRNPASGYGYITIYNPADPPHGSGGTAQDSSSTNINYPPTQAMIDASKQTAVGVTGVERFEKLFFNESVVATSESGRDTKPNTDSRELEPYYGRFIYAYGNAFGTAAVLYSETPPLQHWSIPPGTALPIKTWGASPTVTSLKFEDQPIFVGVIE